MSERYTRLFARGEENLYSEGSPIVISASALLKDNRTGAVLAQLKIKNISRKVIKAAIVCLTAYDAFGKIIDGTVEKEYLDLAVERDAEFGQKVLIPLPNAAARAFTAAVTCVGFADNTVWNYGGEEQAALPKTASISEMLGDDELVKQYRMKYGAEAKSVPQRYKDVWFCACGELNHTDEEACHACGRRIAELLPLDLEALIAEKDDRLKAEIEERRQAEERQRLEREEAERAAKRRKKIAIIAAPIVCAVIAFVILLNTVIIPKQKLNKAINKAMSMIDSGDYDSAYALLEEIGNNDAVASSKYDRAVKLMDSGDYEPAYELLSGLDYRDSSDKLAKCEVERIKSAKVGDSVFFGAYEQDNDTSNGKEDVEWLVLEVKDGKVLLISKYALDCKPYNTSYTDVTWEKCTLRTWLNDDFIHSAFSAEEQALIPAVTVPADKNPDYSTNPGKATQDKVFLLSITEVNQYFRSDSARQCKPTGYAAANGAYVNSDNGNCWWWLRSSGYYQNSAADVDLVGAVRCRGLLVNGAYGAVRPALWINLDS